MTLRSQDWPSNPVLSSWCCVLKEEGAALPDPNDLGEEVQAPRAFCTRELLALPGPRPVGSPRVQRHTDEGGIQPLRGGLQGQAHHGADAHQLYQ